MSNVAQTSARSLPLNHRTKRMSRVTTREKSCQRDRETYTPFFFSSFGRAARQVVETSPHP